MKNYSSIRAHCHVNTNEDCDRFVGIKADSDGAVVYFPIGYELPEKDADIRRDIKRLFQVLSEFTDKKECVLALNKFKVLQEVRFPINAYLEVINDYITKNGIYYTEVNSMYRVSPYGNIDWPQTFRNQSPLIQNGSFVYTQFTVRASTPNDSKLITQIHRYCVYESFNKLGWLYIPNMPEPPQIPFDSKQFTFALRDKLSQTNNDNDKRLFKAMLDMIKYLDEQTSEKQFYFGTYKFEYVWEKLIDKTFGEKNKLDYFPRTHWTLRFGRDKHKAKYPLEPDSIMIYNGKYYVLDAKYYRYGITNNPIHLPDSSSINKQITYGEYVYQHKNIANESLFNAFIMPYNMAKNHFGITRPIGNIGEAVSNWKTNDKNHERIQGIVIDTRYLMHNYIGNAQKAKAALSQAIENVV